MVQFNASDEILLSANTHLDMSLVHCLFNTREDNDMKRIHDNVDGVPKGDGVVLVDAADDEEIEMDDGTPQVRSMAIPRWLSTPEVTRYLVGTGGERLKALEEEHECAIVITGQGSGSRDRKLPGHGLPHLLVTMTGTDVRSLGRLRRSFENRLINYVIEKSFTNKCNDVEGGGEDGDEKVVRPPPSLGRLLYSLGISAMDSSPRTKDRRPDRTVHARSPTLPSLYDRLRHEGGDDDGLETEFKTKKVWMNVCELPQDPTTLEHHGRFLASKSLRTYYREHFKCRVDVFGVWGDDGEGLRGGVEDMMCAPYVMVTSDAKVNVDKCLVHIEHRIREHEEKFKMKRACGRRVLKGEKPQSSMESSLETGLSTPRK